jgi:hypothetical protein
MTERSDKQLAEVLGRIEVTLTLVLEAQRERAKSETEWYAADIRLREDQAKNQRLLREKNEAVQRTQKRTLLGMGMLAALMLLVGLGLVTESLWLPPIKGGRQ